MTLAGSADYATTNRGLCGPCVPGHEPAQPRAFIWVAGLGRASEPPGKFTPFLGQQPLLDLDPTLKDATWHSADGKTILKYTPKSANEQDSSGFMELTIPASRVKPSEAAELRVVGSAAHSRRWLGVYEVDHLSP